MYFFCFLGKQNIYENQLNFIVCTCLGGYFGVAVVRHRDLGKLEKSLLEAYSFRLLESMAYTTQRWLQADWPGAENLHSQGVAKG